MMNPLIGAGEVTIEIIAVLIASIAALIAWYMRSLHKDWADRQDKLDELYHAFFGMENVGTVEGVVDVIESHDNELNNHHDRINMLEDKIEEGKERRQRLAERIEKLKESVENRSGES